jgi:uncharacterized membrane protein
VTTYSPVGARSPAVVWQERIALVATVAAAFAYAGLAGYFSLRRHDAYLSGFDLANFDQVLWLLANGHEPLNTQDGRLFWGEHFSPTIALLTPLYVLGAGPATLLVLQAVTMALVGPLLYALARAYGAAPSLAAVPALLWLVSPLTLIPNVGDLHHVPLAAPAIVGSVLALKHDRLVVFVVLAALACGAKEDISLIYVMLGLVIAVEGRRRLGAAISASALALFVFAVAVYLPAFGGSSAWFTKRFAGDRGDSIPEVATWILTHPAAALGDLVEPEKIGLVLALVGTTGGLCLLAPAWMLLGLPVLAHNLLSAYGPQHGIWYQYQVPIAVSFSIAAAVGVHRLANAGPRVRLAAAAAVTLAVLVAPLGVRWVDGESQWSAESTARLGGPDARRDALALIPADVPLAASTHVTPHLAHRRELYTLPLPFLGGDEIGVDWSPEEMARRAASVKWVVLDSSDRPLELPETPERVRSLLGQLGFRRVFEDGTVSIWVR